MKIFSTTHRQQRVDLLARVPRPTHGTPEVRRRRQRADLLARVPRPAHGSPEVGRQRQRADLFARAPRPGRGAPDVGRRCQRADPLLSVYLGHLTTFHTVEVAPASRPLYPSASASSRHPRRWEVVAYELTSYYVCSTESNVAATPNFIVECVRSRTFHKRSQIVATIDESDINVFLFICMILGTSY